MSEPKNDIVVFIHFTNFATGLYDGDIRSLNEILKLNPSQRQAQTRRMKSKRILLAC